MDASGTMETTLNELDDLGNLFEFGEIDLNNIPDVDSGAFGDAMQQQPSESHPGTHPNTPFQDIDPALLPGSAVADFAGHDQLGHLSGLDQQGRHNFMAQSTAPMSNPNAFMPESGYQHSMSQSQQLGDFHYNPQHVYPQSSHIPPTPNSYEMHGRTGPFMNHPQPNQQFYRVTAEQQRYQMQKDAQIAFTPMASPAGTPQFNMLPEFTAPGAYFSPLSSPMIHAQHSQHAHAHPAKLLSRPTTAPGSAAPSPDESNGDVDMGDGGAGQDLPSRRKSKKKSAAPKSAATIGKARPSPVQKAQKRKPSTKASETDLRRAVTSQPSSTSLRQPESSEAESTSPEPLNESVMGPPPRPASSLAKASDGTPQHAPNTSGPGPAATPKSILQRRGHVNGQISPAPASSSSQPTGDVGGLDDLSLPDAARPPAPAPINTQITAADEEHGTPRASARKTPKLDASSTPSSARLQSALPSPAVAPSPATAASTPAGILQDKKDGKGARANKKRGSVSQNASKNMPRISPSIKPLLPEGSPLHSSTQAMLLASKSNYQNLLEGNHLPGVSYPDSLSTGLTSKRTSHKVAEQGRRNRINDALKEMQALVPKPSPATKAAMKEAEASNGASPEGGEDDKDGVAKSSNSKAATVELANEYIKRMQKDFAAKDVEMDLLRRENDALKRRLAASNAGSSDDEKMEGTTPEKM